MSELTLSVVTREHIDWPFATMQIGDSFLVPDGIKRTTIAAAMQRAEKSGKGMFVSRTMGGSVRIWRFA
jgi:hypothetical protein